MTPKISLPRRPDGRPRTLVLCAIHAAGGIRAEAVGGGDMSLTFRPDAEARPSGPILRPLVGITRDSATLFHCHQQLHMDFGFMALFKYA